MRPLRPTSVLVLLVALGAVADAAPPPLRYPAPAPPPVRPPPTVQRQAGACLGRWVGAGQGASGSPWTIDMVVTAVEGDACGTIEYPSLGCGGTLLRCHVEQGVLVLREYYTHNPGTCAPAGTIRARCEGDQMSWQWDGWETVRTVLTRATR